MGFIQSLNSLIKRSKPAAGLAHSGGFSRCLRTVETPAYMLRNIENLGDKNLSKALAGIKNEQSMTLLDDLVLKMQACDDTKIKAQVAKLIYGIKDSENVERVLMQSNQLLDSVNVASGKYSCLFDDSNYMLYGVRTFVPKNIKKARLAEAKKLLNKGLIENAENVFGDIEQGYSDVRKTVNRLTRQAKTLPPIGAERAMFKLERDEFAEYARLSKIKEYILSNPNEKEMANYLWEKYFLSSLDKQKSNLLRQINEEFGVKVFFDGKVSEASLYWLKEEFAMEKCASAGTAKFPNIYDITNYDPQFNVVNHSSIGVYKSGVNKTCVKTSENIEVSTRHEQVHCNDILLDAEDSERSFKFSKEQRAELRNAGLSDSHINYGETDYREARAVSAEADMDKVSENFKKEMIGKGLPEFFTRLGKASCRGYLNNKFVQLENHEKIFADLETRLGGRISACIADMLVRDETLVKFVPDILKNCDKKVIDDVEFAFLMMKSKQEMIMATLRDFV